MNTLKTILLFTILTLTTQSLSARPKYPSLYQISTRPFLYQLSQEYGQTLTSLRDIPDKVFTDFKNKNFDYVWFMGVWQVGEYGIKHDRESESLVNGYKQILPDYTSEDAIGCPYSITDYVCNKELCPNGDEDLLWLKQKLNSLGIRLILDFIPNHFSLDSVLIDENKDYFIQAPKGSSPPYDSSRYFTNGIAYGNMQWSSAWTDVAQLNYYNEDTRTMMKKKLLKIAEYADGVRCDMAYIMLNDYFYGTWKTELDSYGWTKPSEEFWLSAIKEVKNSYPDIIFLAEVYGDVYKDLINLGFDYTYDKELLDRFKTGNMDNIRDWIYNTNSYSSHLCRFIENHDDNRATEMFGYYIKRTDITALATYTLPGMKFYFQDQWYAYKNKLDVHLRRSYNENKSDEAIEFYNKFLPIVNQEIFRNGDYTVIYPEGDSNWRLICITWKNNDTGEKLLVVVNYTDASGWGLVKLSDISGSGSIQLKELLSGEVYERNRDEIRSNGLYVGVDAYSSQIFAYD